MTTTETRSTTTAAEYPSVQLHPPPTRAQTVRRSLPERFLRALFTRRRVERDPHLARQNEIERERREHAYFVRAAFEKQIR
ncbi:hypothetical protein [Paramicrobacterium humi]|uniref:hypothetical protein n=1 Tax=Paramicrobacterium humi TaxID=640635 RepID=UPI000B84D925|nr:hypothetical protein [Microbacterium humi]